MIPTISPSDISHSPLAVRKTSFAVAWGDNSYGQLGNKSTTQSPVPIAVTATGILAGKTVTAVSAGAHHSLALCSDGTLAAWGLNFFGQASNDGARHITVPTAVDRVGLLANKTISIISAGEYHSLALSSDGKLYAWGQNVFGQLGDDSTVDSHIPVEVEMTGILADKIVTAIAAGAYHCLALCSDGTLAAWGHNYYGQLGNNTKSTHKSKLPIAIEKTDALTGKTVIAISAGASHCLALCSDGTLVAWGQNCYGQLGNDSIANSDLPVAINKSGVLKGKTVKAVSASAYHNLALCSDGTLAAWGFNRHGQLGNNTTTQSLKPVAVDAAGVLAGKTVTDIATGEYHSLALCSDGTLAAWGYNSRGQLGNNSTISSSVPVAVSNRTLDPDVRVVAIATGSNAFHNLALVATAPDSLTPPSK